MNHSPLLENGSLRLKKCRYGYMFYLTTDQYIGECLDRYGEFSEGESDLFRNLIRPGWIVIEVGANVGTHTVQLAQLVGRQGAVHAFEPQRVLFQMLCGNLTVNGITNVLTHQVAVSHKFGSLLVPQLDLNTKHNFGGLPLGQWEHGERVAMATIDAMNLSRCEFIKIDVEGMECDVLAGAAQTIQRLRPILYVENDRRDKSPELLRQLLNWDYRLYWHLPMLYNPQNFFGSAEDVFPGIASVNVLGIHRSFSQRINGLREVTSDSDWWRVEA